MNKTCPEEHGQLRRLFRKKTGRGALFPPPKAELAYRPKRLDASGSKTRPLPFPHMRIWKIAATVLLLITGWLAWALVAEQRENAALHRQMATLPKKNGFTCGAQSCTSKGKCLIRYRPVRRAAASTSGDKGINRFKYDSPTRRKRSGATGCRRRKTFVTYTAVFLPCRNSRLSLKLKSARTRRTRLPVMNRKQGKKIANLQIFRSLKRKTMQYRRRPIQRRF